MHETQPPAGNNGNGPFEIESSNRPMAKALLHYGVLDGHVMATDPDTEEIRAVTPRAVYVYRCTAVKHGCLITTEHHYDLMGIEGLPLRVKHSNATRSLAEDAWSEAYGTDDAMHVAGLWEFNLANPA